MKSPRLEDPDGALPGDLLYLQPGAGLGGDGALGPSECRAEWGVSGAPGDRAPGTLCVFSRVVYPGQTGDSRTCGERFWASSPRQGLTLLLAGPTSGTSHLSVTRSPILVHGVRCILSSPSWDFFSGSCRLRDNS